MKGLMFVEKGKAEFVDEPMPMCAPDAMLLRTLYSGLANNTERNYLIGGFDSGVWPNQCAYQLVSRVVDVGDRLKQFKPGDDVFTSTVAGHVEFHTAREDDLIVKLPKEFDLQSAALLGIAAEAMHNVRRAGITVDDHVLVVGAGLLGQFVAQAANATGAMVTITDHDEERLLLAGELGVDRMVKLDTPSGQAQLDLLKPFSVIMECSGASVLERLIGRGWEDGLIGHRGRLVLLAERHDVHYAFHAGHTAEIAILHAKHFTNADVEHVIRLVQKGIICIRPLIRDSVPITDALSIYDTLRDRPDCLLGTVFSWNHD